MHKVKLICLIIINIVSFFVILIYTDNPEKSRLLNLCFFMDL